MTPQVFDQIRAWQAAGQKVVLVTGVFDILHIEHFRFLTKAKAAGDKLVVGIESDKRVTRIKGHTRPLNNQAVRREQLEMLKPVDFAFVLPEQFDTQADWEDLLHTLKPNVYAVSSHTSYLDNKQVTAEKFGVNFQVVHRHNPEYSTSRVVEALTREL